MLLSDGFTSDDVSAQLEAAGGGGGDTNDTGLGSDLECSETRHIVGKADFSEPEGTLHVVCVHHLRLHVHVHYMFILHLHVHRNVSQSIRFILIL